MRDGDGGQPCRLSRLCALLGIREEEVLNVYLVGSRLFGIHKPHADYDLKVVISDSSSYAGPSDVQKGDGAGGFEVDAHIYPLRTFLERIEDQDPQALTCLFLPNNNKNAATTLSLDDAATNAADEWVWKETIKVEYFVRLTKLYRSVYHEADTNWSKAFRLWRRRDRIVAALEAGDTSSLTAGGGRDEDNDPALLHYRARKCIVHAIRFAQFGLQIAQHGAITDYKVANDLFYELLPEKNEAKSESESEAATLHPPQYYEAKYEPTLRSLIRQLKAYVTREVEAAEKKEGDDPLASLLNQNTHSRRKGKAKGKKDELQLGQTSELHRVLAYLNHPDGGLRGLCRYFGVKVKRSLAYPDLYHLTYSDSSSPMGCALPRGCRALVAAKEEGEWRAVCFPFPKFYYYGAQQIFERGNRDPSRLLQLPDQVEAGPVEVTSQLKGVMVALYRHRGEWLLNTLMGPDGMHPFSVTRGSSLAETARFALKPTSSMPLADYFWQVWRRKQESSNGADYRLPATADGESSPRWYIFEFTSPHLQVASITRPQRQPELGNVDADEAINLLAARDTRTLELVNRSEVESIAAAYGWRCVPCHRFDSLHEAVTAAHGLPFESDSKGLVLQCNMPAEHGCGGREVMVRLPASAYIAFSNLKERLADEEKNLDPDAWEWNKEDYDFDSMNRLCMLELVRWRFCTMSDGGGGGESSVDDEPTAATSHRYLDHWGSEHHEMYLRVRQTFLEYAAGLQSVFDRVVDGMLTQERSEERREAEAEGKSEDEDEDEAESESESEGKERSKDNATKRPAAGRREQLVRTSLRVMSADEKRWFAQEVARVCGEPDEEMALRYRALLFEMKKESCASARELMAKVHTKFLEDLLFGVKNNKVLLV